MGLAQNGQTPGATACAALSAFRIPGEPIEITKAEWIPAAAAPATPPGRGYGGPVPAYCKVSGVINRRTGVGGREFGIGFEVALPQDWNHDFLMQGGGGTNGVINPPLGAQVAGDKPGLVRGFAVVSNDTGHKNLTAGLDGSFRVDQQAVLDFAYEANVRVAEMTKRMIADYYGRETAHSYFVGCSTGGREGMILTQRYPTEFDGVVSGAPAMVTGLSGVADRWVSVSLNQAAPKDAAGNPIPRAGLSESDRKLVIDGILQRCDARDGIRDGMIFDPVGCDFNPATLTCAGPKTDTCLTSQQVAAIQRAFGGPKDSRGVQVYPGFFFDTGINASTGMPGLLTAPPPPQGGASPTEQDVDREGRGRAESACRRGVHESDYILGPWWKQLFYHGVSDPWFSAQETLSYYKQMAAANGGLPQVTNWSRLYLVPGMGHCQGGAATLDRMDMLSAIVDWVEKGTAPDFVVATGRAFPGRSRPLCAWPKHAQYTGEGDPEDYRSFVCQE
jgi:hypothetical protein